MSVSVSIIIPTRDRAKYLPHSVRTCLANPGANFEVLVLDNASRDDTEAAIDTFRRDTRFRYVRSDSRLSMRDNFEKGLTLAGGEVLCFIGDDDGLFPNSIRCVTELLADRSIGAVIGERAHYFWPDLISSRRGCALLPRHRGLRRLNARAELGHLLSHGDYYRLPCLYHGFVRRSVIDDVIRKSGRFFLSTQVDMYSSLALSMENIDYVFSRSPLVINGGSARSNGASHFGGGTREEKERWKKEDNLGFLDGFDQCRTIPALIIESAFRYAAAFGPAVLDSLGREAISKGLSDEIAAREGAGQPAHLEAMSQTAGFSIARAGRAQVRTIAKRALQLLKSFEKYRPLDMRESVDDVNGAAALMQSLIETNQLGLLATPFSQYRAAMLMTGGR